MAFTPTYVPQTELDSVNQMLWSIGQSPVNTLAAPIKDVQVARQALHNVLREVLEEGWDFNTDDNYTLAKDVNGKVSIPATAMRCDPTSPYKRFVERVDTTDSTRRFYDKDNHTFVIGDDVKVDIVWLFPFEQLPQAARAYIAHKAARVFQVGAVGTRILYEFTKEREMETRAALEKAHHAGLDGNLFSHDTIAATIFHRHQNYR